MFIIFKNFVLYLLILSRTFTQPLNGNEDNKGTAPDIEQVVEKELSSIKDRLKKIMDPLTNNDEKIELKGEVQGAVKKIIERAVNGDELLKNQLKNRDEQLKNLLKNRDELLKNQTRLEMQKDDADMYQLLLALTFRVDTLEKLLAPGEEFKGMQRSKRWTYIFTKNTPQVQNFLNKVHAAGMTEVSFAEQVERLIQERNNRAGHANIPLPRLIKEKTIDGALAIMEITEDEKAVETIKILVAPVKGLDFTTTPTSQKS